MTNRIRPKYVSDDPIICDDLLILGKVNNKPTLYPPEMLNYLNGVVALEQKFD